MFDISLIRVTIEGQRFGGCSTMQNVVNPANTETFLKGSMWISEARRFNASDITMRILDDRRSSLTEPSSALGIDLIRQRSGTLISKISLT